MARTALAAKEISARLKTLAGWKREGKSIAKRWEFEDYAHGVLFTNAIAHLAEQRDHHPEVTVGYDFVRVVCATHDAGGVTASDFSLAEAVDALPLKWYGKPSKK